MNKETAVVTTAELEQIKNKLAEYGADESTIEKIVNELGADTLDDLASLEANDLTSAGMKLAKARKLVNELKAITKLSVAPISGADAPAVGAATAQTIQNLFEALLPHVPSDESWLNSLKTGGVLKVDDSSYIAAIRAALADRAGLYNIPEALASAMETYSDETEEQVDPTFYALRKSLTRRSYGEIFAAIDGLDGAFITEGRRKKFLERIRETLWPAITESYLVLDNWYQTWRSNYSDPSILIAAMSGGLNGGNPGMVTVAPPDVTQLHDAGDTLVDSINRVFRGTGVQVAAAMAYDASSIRNTLEDSRLPSMIGVKNRELMLKKIGLGVSSNYIRLEQNLVKYVLAFVKHNTVAADVAANYFVALWQLGTQINWDELNGNANASSSKSTNKSRKTGLTNLSGDVIS